MKLKIWHFTFDLFSIDWWEDEFLLNFFEITINYRLFVVLQFSLDERKYVENSITFCNLKYKWIRK